MLKKALYLLAFLTPLLAENSAFTILGNKLPALIYVALFPLIIISGRAIRVFDNFRRQKALKFVVLYLLLAIFNYAFVVGDLFWRPFEETTPLWMSLGRRIVFVVVVISVFETPREFVTFFISFWAGMMLSGLSAYVEMLILHHHLFDSSVEVGNEGFQRALGFYYNPNEFAISVVLVIILLLYVYLTYNRYKRLALLGALALMPPLVFSYSRVGLASLLVAIFLFLKRFSGTNTKRRFVAVGGAITVAIVWAALSVPELNARVLSIITGDDPSQVGRLIVIAAAYQQWLMHPLVGIGVYVSTTLLEGTGNAGLLLSIHNYYLHALFETGIIGFIISVGLLYSVYSGYRRLGCLESTDRLLSWFSKMLTIMLPVYYFYLMFGNQVISDYFWFMIAGEVFLVRYVYAKDRQTAVAMVQRSRPSTEPSPELAGG